MMSHSDLVDRVYEAAMLPELWPAVLADLSRFAEGDGALLFTIDGSDFRYMASDGIDAVVADYVAEGWPARTDRAARLFERRHAGFLTDLDVYTPAEVEEAPVYRDFLRPRGLGWGAASAIVVPTGDCLVFDVERSHARGPVPPEAVARLDRLRPHLARAATLSARLRLQTLHGAAQALDTLGLPAVVLGSRGKILAMSEACEGLPPGLLTEGRRLVLGDPGADRLLAQALDGLGHEDRPSVRSIPLPAGQGREPMILHVVPIRRAGADLFNAASSLAVVTPLTRKAPPCPTVLEGLFDLTGAEARVARGIADCRTVDQIAGEFGLSRETVRSQLKAVLAKTGMSRQSELVGLLAAGTLPHAV
ncbi:helix-turn-helix transcriptional regulator [Methylobacterium oryzisoli]|uniref:helix-turn-helix transcriptional regulator n=1 Tax=Methylobacterium oryzisoli TaxID=3385502 RepID=UPI0038926EEA